MCVSVCVANGEMFSLVQPTAAVDELLCNGHHSGVSIYLLFCPGSLCILNTACLCLVGLFSMPVLVGLHLTMHRSIGPLSGYQASIGIGLGLVQ